MLRAHLRKIPTYLLLTIFLVPYAAAEEMSAAADRLTIADGTPINLRLAESICSAHARVGDPLEFVVVRDVNVGGFTVIKAGTMARGTVTGVKGRRILGIGGNVSLKLDSVELANGERVELRASKEVKGGSRTKLMVGAMIATSLIFLPATPVFLLTRGHSSTVLKSTEITAQIAGPTSLLSAGLARSRENSSELGEMMEYLPPRIFNGEGREGDMVNLVFVAQQQDLQEAFERAGWIKTDRWRPSFVWHLAQHGTKDTSLPMARFYLFGRVQDYSFALPDPGAVVSRRHHLRIWKTGSTMNGTPIWAGAATHDVAIEIAKRGHLINHTIDPNVDAERDFVAANLTGDSSVRRQEYLRSDNPVFEAKTASGESYHSDSRILLLDIQHVAPPTTVASEQSPSMGGAIVPPIEVPEKSFQSNLTAQR